MTLNDEDLRVTEAKGKVRVTTHSKNVDLSQIYGDTYVEDRDGNISIEPAGTYNVEAKSNSGKGDIELTLPPNASATISAYTHNGDILSDYRVTYSRGGEQEGGPAVGGGGAKINLSTDVGDVRIKKGSGFPSAPSISANPPKRAGAAQRAASEGAEDAGGAGDAVRQGTRDQGTENAGRD